MMSRSAPAQESTRDGKLAEGRLKKLYLRYLEAHKYFKRGEFSRAIAMYGGIRQALHPHFVAIVRRNLGLDLAPGQDLSDEQVRATLEGRAGETLRRLDPKTREGRTANLCSAMAHDAALMARHLAEGTARGRDPEVANAILASFAHAIAVAPDNPTNYHNLAGYEDYLGRDRDACIHYQWALQIDQYQWESWVSWGHAAARLNDMETAEHCWANGFLVIEGLERRDIEKTQKRTPRWGIAMPRLLRGDYALGWEDYEARLTFPPYLEKHGRPDLKAPLWNNHRPVVAVGEALS